jgi:hypothetical protein
MAKLKCAPKLADPFLQRRMVLAPEPQDIVLKTHPRRRLFVKLSEITREVILEPILTSDQVVNPKYRL